MKVLLAVWALAFLAANTLVAQAATEDFAGLVRTRATVAGARGLSLVLVDPRSVDHFFCSGRAGQNQKMTRESVACVGSVSKVLVPIADLKLVQDGTVDLDAPASKYVSDFAVTSPSGKPITVRSLLAHESG